MISITLITVASAVRKRRDTREPRFLHRTAVGGGEEVELR